MDADTRQDGNEIVRKMHATHEALAQRLKGKQGEFVLMIERSVEPAGPCHGGSFSPLHETFSLGVLASDLLHRTEGETLPFLAWAFGTRCYAQRGGHMASCMHRNSIYHRHGVMAPQHPALAFRYLDESVDFRGHRHPEMAQLSLGVDAGKPIVKLTLCIGNEEIDAWCRNNPAGSEPLRPRVKLIVALAKVLEADPRDVPAVRHVHEKEGPKINEALRALVQRRREAEDLLRATRDEHVGTEQGRVMAQTHREILDLIAQADEIGFEDASTKNLRTEYPTTPAT